MKPQQIIGQIQKNVFSKNWKCIIENCEEKSINSHFLQRNGILNMLTENQHLIEVKASNAFYFEKNKSIVDFKKIGIHNALSINLFCSHHDTEIFKNIEQISADFSTYESFLLLSYRITCAELRKKEMQLEIYKRISNSKSLERILDLDYTYRYINGLILGISDLNKIKELFEQELFLLQLEHFKFHIFRYPRIDIYASAIFSPNEDEVANSEKEDQLENLYIHILPRENETLILIGYHKNYCNQWMKDFALSWRDLDTNSLQIKLSELLACRIENWGMSQKLFNKIQKSKIDLFIKNVHANISNQTIDKSIQFNLFS